MWRRAGHDLRLSSGVRIGLRATKGPQIPGADEQVGLSLGRDRVRDRTAQRGALRHDIWRYGSHRYMATQNGPLYSPIRHTCR